MVRRRRGTVGGWAAGDAARIWHFYQTDVGRLLAQTGHAHSQRTVVDVVVAGDAAVGDDAAVVAVVGGAAAGDGGVHVSVCPAAVRPPS